MWEGGQKGQVHTGVSFSKGGSDRDDPGRSDKRGQQDRSRGQSYQEMLSESHTSTGPTASSTPTQEGPLHLSDNLLDPHTHTLLPHTDHALALGRWKP